MKGTWKILRKAMNKEAKQSDIETIFVDNEEVNDKQEISERFNDHFSRRDLILGFYCRIQVNSSKLQLHDAIYRLRFYSNSLIRILSLSNGHNNVAKDKRIGTINRTV